MSIARTSLHQPLMRRLMPLAWGLAALVGLLLLFTWSALQVQVALAGFLNGESIWSKAQKQAIINLDNYARSGKRGYLELYEHNHAVLMHDRLAREEVTREHFDSDKVAQMLRADNAIPEAIPVIIFMMRHLNRAPYMKESLDAWRSTDASIDELDQVAQQLKAAYANGSATPAWLGLQRERIDAINRYIEPRSNRFSHMMARGAVWVAHMLFIGMLAVSIVATFIWMFMARRTLAGIRGSEERYRLLFDSAADAIFMVEDATGRILQANRAALAWTGRKLDELQDTPFYELFEQRTRKVASDRQVSVLKSAHDEPRPVEMLSSVARWGDKLVRQAILRDITERLQMEHERRIASEALASVAEGVIITDSERRILTVNAAHARLTGFGTSDARGARLEEYRRMPDGAPLPELIWATVARSGHWSGEVQSRRNDGSVYPELLSISVIRGVDGGIEQYVAVCTDITDSKAGQRHLQYLATHDALTGLVNRAEFERRVAAAIVEAERRHEAVAVLFVDLDNFKLINDSYSHAIGDKLLAAAAERIHRQLPQGAIAGRIGGDEFTILVSHLKAREDVAWLAERLIDALAQTIVVEDYEVGLSASIGVAAYPLDAYDAGSLITNADAAMYSVKLEERSTFRFYSPKMRADANRRLLLLTDLRSALEQDQFELLFQPSVMFEDGRLGGAEALIRWQHPERGLIMPGEFIPLAETLSLIRYIDEWVIERVCKHVAQWKNDGLPAVRVAVNISARWFTHEDFIGQLRRTIEKHGIDPRQIMLEITESTILNLGDATRATMSALHALGVEVAIDDFGTGYSSLSYLKLPAVAYLKVDRIFVEGLPESAEDASIVQAMLVMARSLGLSVIAEGVETEPQHEFLRAAGCLEGQGYLYSKPVAAANFESMMRDDVHHGPARLKLVPPEQRS